MIFFELEDDEREEVEEVIDNFYELSEEGGLACVGANLERACPSAFSKTVETIG